MDRQVYNDTQMGMLKAMHFLWTKNPKVKVKRRYEKDGLAVHATRCLRKDERAKLNDVLLRMNVVPETDHEAMKALFAELRAMPVKLVQIKREFLLKHDAASSK